MIIDLDFDRTINAFRQLGDVDFQLGLDHHKSIFYDYEVGSISTSEFLTYWQEKLPNASETEIIDAWNALLLGIQPQVFDLLNQLKSDYRLFVYSNTNDLHITWVKRYLHAHGHVDWDGTLFEKTYYSHEINTRKPEAAGFQLILSNHNLKSEATLFIDDHLPNIQAALELGLHAMHKPVGVDLKAALSNNKLIKTRNL